MITPHFTLSQTTQAILLTIRAKYLQTQHITALVTCSTFHFHAHPYFLRLTFPVTLKPTDEPALEYHVDNGTVTVELLKEDEVECPDLDLLAKFLVPPGEQREKGVGISEIRPELDDVDGEVDLDWHVEQPLPFADSAPYLLEGHGYGFMRQHSGAFTHLQEDYRTLFDFTSSPEAMSYSQRRQARLSNERASFSEDHYMFDYVNDTSIKDIMASTDHWWLHQAPGSPVTFSTKENELMIKLKYKSYVIDSDSAEEHRLYLGLVDLLYAYCYERRCRPCTGYDEDEYGPESGWTCGKLAVSFSGLETFEGMTVSDVVLSSIRRTLVFPLYRHWELALRVWSDVIRILRFRRRGVLRALLWLKDMFDHDDLRYRFSLICVDHYCSWVLSLKRHKMLSLARSLQDLLKDMDKCKLSGFRLREWERLALELAQE